MKLIYKQHEKNAVSIPKDWKLKELGSIVDFLDNSRKPIKDNDRLKIQGNIPYYGASGIVDYINDFLFDEDLILLGEDGENIISRNSRLAFKISGKSWVNNHAHVLRVHQEVDINYLSEYLESLNYEQYNTGTAQPKLNKSTCLGIPVLLPPRVEQHAIATALNDMDALLESLNILIAKKRAIKQATMQQLLSGETRVSSPQNDWTDTTLGEIVERFVGGGTPSRTVADYWGGNIPWVSTKDFASFSPYTSQESITKKGLKNSAASLIPAETLLISTRMAVGRTAIYKVDVAINQDIKALIPRAHISQRFLLHWLNHNNHKISSTSNGSTVSGISITDLKRIKIKIPNIHEQNSIARILDDLDHDISILESRIHKTNSLKQAMMQELLTGRTRLI